MSPEEREALLNATSESSSHGGLSSNISSSSSTSRLRPSYFSPGRYWKNLVVLSSAFMFTMSAYSALANLQSSLNYSSGLGVASLCAIYIGVIISSLLSPLVVWVLKVKWTMVVCSVFFALYSASNIYPVVYTLIPAAALLGLAASPFWTTVATYITTSSIQLAYVTDSVPETIINRFNGIFFCIVTSGLALGNLISSLALRNTSSSEIMDVCGRSSCGTGISFNLTGGADQDVAEGQTLLLISIYIGLGLIASCIFALFLDRLPEVGHKESKTSSHLSEHLSATFRQMKIPYLFLLIPLMIYNCAEQAFIGADFTKKGTSTLKVGFGVADAVSSVIFGQLEKYSGRIAIFIFGGMVHMSLLVAFELWNPEHSATSQMVLMAVGWGIGDAVMQTQISSILGVLFPEFQEPAFGNFWLWQAVGFAVSYALTVLPEICVYHKLYGLLGWLAFSLLCYITDEYLIWRPLHLARTERHSRAWRYNGL